MNTPTADPKCCNVVMSIYNYTIHYQLMIVLNETSFMVFSSIVVGVWFLHCHLEVHTTWGLKMAFVVDNGKGPNESLIPPPSDLPVC